MEAKRKMIHRFWKWLNKCRICSWMVAKCTEEDCRKCEEKYPRKKDKKK